MDTNNGNNQYNNSNGQYNNENNQYNGNGQYNGNIPYNSNTQYGGTPSSNGLQVAGLVCGILAICFSCCCGIPGVVLGIVGIICSVNGNKESTNGIGTAGIVCSVVGLILGVLVAIYFGVVYFATLRELLNTGIGYDYY